MGPLEQLLIDPPRWGEFCRLWGGGHRGWLVDVGGARDGWSLARERSLRGLALTGDGGLVVTVYGGGVESFAVRHLARIVELVEGGADAGVRLEPRGSRPVVVRFCVPARPEQLDGLPALEE